MKKKTLAVLSLSLLAMTIGACANRGNTSVESESPSSSESVTVKYTVAFNVDGQRYKTVKVKEGETIAEDIPNPSKEGFKFTGWYEGTTLVDLATYVVTKDVTFEAGFEEIKNEDVLNVDDTKDATKTYSLVFGWWEVNDPADPTKVTSGLTRDSVRMFYSNLNRYLAAVGQTEEQIKAVSFRNYSSATVAEMGAAINADADVELMIGVGANIFTTAGVAPFNTSDDSKFQTTMGASAKSRYVAIIKDAKALAQATYSWLQTDAGKASLLRELTDAEITASLAPATINLTVTVHGDTDATTLLDDADDVVTMPAITNPEGKVFKGFATTSGGEVALNVAKDATLKYNDVKGLVADGATTLDLYPVFEDAPVASVDLTVYVQTHATRLPEYEAALLESRFEAATGTDIKVVTSTTDAAGFTSAVQADATCDVVVGGNNPVNNFAKYDGTTTGAAGAKHFKDTSRKVVILSTVHPDHVTLAQQFYDFVTAEAAAFELHTTFWAKGGGWVTADEEAAIKASLESTVKSYLNVTDGTLEDAYNVSLSYYDAVNTKVADLGTETNALREGKGTDLIIGCGSNVSTTGGVTVVEKKDIPTTIVAASRQVALVNDTCLARAVYDTVFTTAQ